LPTDKPPTHRVAEIIASMATDGYRDREVTESFIKASGPVRVETDRVSKVTYTIQYNHEYILCVHCDEQIDHPVPYILKRTPLEYVGATAPHVDYHYCIACGCSNIYSVREKKIEAIPEIDTSLYITEKDYKLFAKDKIHTRISIDYKMHMKITDEVKEMTPDKDIEDDPTEEGFIAATCTT
jgi:hypothetical protein